MKIILKGGPCNGEQVKLADSTPVGYQFPCPELAASSRNPGDDLVPENNWYQLISQEEAEYVGRPRPDSRSV